MTSYSSTQDTNNCNNNNNNNKQEAIAEFRNLVLNLASSRPDVLSAKNRNVLIQSAQQHVIADASTGADGASLKDEDIKNDNDDKDDDNEKNDDDEKPAVLSTAEAREILANWKGTHCPRESIFTKRRQRKHSNMR
jgi:hypothetical protein